MRRYDIFFLVNQAVVGGVLRLAINVSDEFVNLSLGLFRFGIVSLYAKVSVKVDHIRGSKTYICLHLMGGKTIEEMTSFFICFHLGYRSRRAVRTREQMRRTSSFLLAHPSSNAGNSTPFNNSIARNALEGSSNWAKPNPCGLLAGVIRRLKDLIGPQACYTQVNSEKSRRTT